jgi:RHS repeat-associated protein
MSNVFHSVSTARAKQLFIALAILLSCRTMNAAIETATNRVSGTQVATGAIITTVDNKYTFMSANPTWYANNFKVASGKGRVRCGVDHGSTVYVGSDYDYTFYLKIEYVDTSLGAPTTVYRQLTVTYDYLAVASYKDAAVYEVNTSKVVWIRATIDSIRNNLTSTFVSTAANNMYVEATTEVQRYYYVDYTTVPSNSVLFYTAPQTAGVTDSNEVRVEWNYMDGAEEYDLEWTYVNDYNSSGGSLATSAIYYDFDHNSTRITTTSQNFNIPVLFDKGYILFRLRAVGRAYDASSGEWKRVSGRWTSDGVGSADTLDDFPTAHRYQITTAHESLMNWQYMSTFAEQGKKKEVMSYYDGSLRNRQTVTKTSTDKKVIVGETFYDYQGRPAVTALPAPVPGTDQELKFYIGFNRNDSTASNAKTYNRFNFDKDVSACSSATRPMSNSSGASYYYSASNIDTSFQQGWLASASKYPFAQVEYMPDNTGRVRRQGGVGPDHQLDSKHETKYFYGQPYQEELDRLFGSEAGYKKHYNKTVTVDANEQASVSYMDQEGRVVATALAGQNPYNLTALTNPAGTALYLASKDTMTVQLLAKDSANAVDSDWDDNILSTDGKTLSLNTQLTVSFPQTYKFSYDMDGVEYDPACLPGAVCYECVYNLTIEIRDQCGTVIADTTKIIGRFDTVCASAPASFTINPPALNVSLAQGVYTVTKTLSVNDDTLETYWQDFLDRSTCVRTLQSFIDSAKADIDTSGCHIQCATCGDFEYVSACETGYQMMLSDVSPSGQYAEYMVNGSPSPAQYPVSVLNDVVGSNYLPMYNATWRHPLRRDSISLYDRRDSLHYFDHNNAISRIPLVAVGGGNYYPPVQVGTTITTVNGVPTCEPQKLLNVEDFVLYWQPTWAKSLVIFHPEYVYYQWCRENTIAQGSGADTLTSDEYDSLMVATTTVAQAHQRGLLNPLGNAYAAPSQSSCKDPYFRSAGQGSHQYNHATKPDACEYSKNYQGNSISIWKLAKIMTSCGTIYGTSTDVDNCLKSHLSVGTLPTNDTVYIVTTEDWLAFRGLYFSIKQHFQSDAARDTSMYWDGFNGCIGNPQYNAYAEGMFGTSWLNVNTWAFNDTRDTLRQHPCGLNYNYYLGKVKRYPSEKDISPSIATAWGGNPNSLLNAQQTNYNAQVQNGQCPAAMAFEALLNAINDEEKLRTTDSLYHYDEFSLAMYNAMVASSPLRYPIWTPSGTGATLTATFAGTGVSCSSVRLRFPAGSYTWSGYTTSYDIDRFYNMQAIDADSFSVIAAIDHDMNPATANIDVVMTGSSGCYDISCTVPTACTPSGESRELFNLMNMLAIDSARFYSSSGSGFRLDTGYIGQYFNNTQLRNRLGTGTFYWYRNSTTSYKIWNGSGAYPSMDISIPSMIVSVDYFANLTLAEVDSLGMTAYNGASGTNVGLEIIWHHQTGKSGSYDETLALGDCGSLVPSICVGDEFTRRDDLEALLNHMAQDSVLESRTVNGHLLNNYGPFTSTLEAPIGYGSYRWISSESGLVLTANVVNTVDTSNACAATLTFSSTPGGSNSWEDVDYITGLWADESNLYNGVAHNFTAIAWFPGGASTAITGTSCYALRNCNQCISDAGNKYENFEDFNSATPSYTTTLTYDATCPSTGEYTVTDSASVLCTNNAYKNGDHTQPNSGSYYFTVFSSNGAQTLWSDTTAVTAYTAYNFSVWYMDADTSTNTHVTLELWVDGTLLTSVAVTDNAGTWKLLSAKWNGAATAANKIIQVKTSGGGAVNTKLGIDDIAFYTIGCEPSVVIEPSPTYAFSDSCRQHQVYIATLNGQNQYAQYIDSTEQDFKARYIAQCMGNAIENFNVEYVLNEYQYTLYYYDQGGNLVRTVPPQGVSIVNLDTYGQTIKNDRANSTANPNAAKTFFTSHTMATTYTYNTLNQLTQQLTPDGDTTRFWYDALGRIVLSQNAKQKELLSSNRRYSYTKYDEQGRIKEVGELSTTTNFLAQSHLTQRNWLSHANFPDSLDGGAVSTSNPRYQVTKTYYDATQFSLAATRMPSATQSNLRKRVVSAALYPYYTGTDSKYATASHYSYDIHGNVKELVQEDSTLRGLDDAGNSRYQSYKTFEYTYDLVSGNVNMLAYQHGQADAFYYRYEYDADNRVTAAYTHAGALVTRQSKGSTGVGASGGSVMASSPELWDRDAKYFYYQHGPLARTEVGHNKVQGSDYAYTLHGWIKGVNSNALTAARDMGNDSLYLNKYVAADEYGYQLTYYDTTGKKDYTSITTNPAFASQSGSSLSTSSYNLWNGNIKNMITSVASFMPNGRPQARAFTYDQLNRIKIAQVDTAFVNSGASINTWSTGGNLNQWKETFAYDYNGNITTLVRHGKSPTTMDSMSYNYTANTNKLTYVDDAVAAGNYTTDIDDQSSGNYDYDKIGNLVKDVSEEIDTIVWNVYGKIERVVRTSASTKSDLEFRYDAMGNRICKIVKPRDGVSRLDQNAWTYTYYLRDASGNVIAVYDRDYSTPAGTYTDEFSLKEDHLYGSSRVGIRSVDEVVCTTTYTYVSTSNGIYTGTFSSRTATAASTTNFNHELKRKAFELSNHLGNVLVTVSDARTATNSSGTVTAFNAVVLSAQDYYAFGSAMVGRSVTSSSYRYAFNGQEKVDEIVGGDLDFGARIYDSRLGRFFSRDRFADHTPYYSPYIFAGCSPINAIDANGDSIKLKFAAPAIMNIYVNWMNKQLEGQFEVQLQPINDADGYNYALKIVATANGGDESKMTEGGKWFYRYLKHYSELTTYDVSQEVVQDDKGVRLGSYNSGKIDIGDLMAIDAAGDGGVTGRAIYVHELYEQMYKTVAGYKDITNAEVKSHTGNYVNYEKAHRNAFGAENKVSQTMRMGGGLYKEKDGTYTKVVFNYDSDTGILTVNKTKNVSAPAAPAKEDDH